MKFYVGIHHPDKAQHLERCCVSANRLASRQVRFGPNEWLLDSGAFTKIAAHGCYTDWDLTEYLITISNFFMCGQLQAAVTQDLMCEPAMLKRTGLTIADHQRVTIERFLALREGLRRQNVVCGDQRCSDVYLMPVLQGYELDDYVSHVRQYGELLAPGAWVGVGSVCKRNRKPADVEAVLRAIKGERPDLRLHGFGVKLTALQSPGVRELLHSADSMAWSFAARKQGRDSNSWQEAKAWAERVENM